jgi:hypothetical protein
MDCLNRNNADIVDMKKRGPENKRQKKKMEIGDGWV